MHAIKALQVTLTDGARAPALNALVTWSKNKKRRNEFREILYAVGLAGVRKRIADEDYIKEYSQKTGIFELRTPRTCYRLFFFYHPGTDEIVVLVGSYEKIPGDNAKSQSEAFRHASNLMDMYFSWLKSQRR
ncbi:MAG: hypothetical protein NTX50_21455 [Candidatus Sumerlaeota bacterium]|nr:hypothetical protein [Candidatus Sumerlaeota bacterium]